MSLLEETAYITMKLDYDKSTAEPTMVPLIQDMDNGGKVRRHVFMDDGESRGKLEGFCRLKAAFDRHCVPLQWEDDDKFTNLEMCLTGRAQSAYERVISRAHWTNANNRVDANWDQFYWAIAIELANQQPNIRDVIYAHLEKAIKEDEQDPWATKDRFMDVCRFADTLPGNEAVPNDAKKLSIFYGLFNKSYRAKFAAVPRQITDATEDIATVAKFMHGIWKSERDSGVRADGKPLKRKAENHGNNHNNNGNDNNHKVNRNQFKKAKRGQNNSRSNNNNNNNGNNQDGMCHHHKCANVRPHQWVNCWNNRNGNNYRPNQGNGGRGGRGNGGGNGGGRGNYNNNNNNNNRGNGNAGGGNNNGNNTNGQSYHNDGNNGNNNGNSGGASQVSNNSNYQNNANMGSDQHHFDTVVMPAPAPRVVTNPNGTTRPWSARLDGEVDDLSLFTTTTANGVAAN